MITQTPNIPRVCLCGVARSGTSMMMRILSFGGLTVDVEPKNLDPFTMRMMREPYGMMENFTAVQANEFINSFKLIDHNKLPLIPNDYKFIFIHRPLEQILASWDAIAEIYNSMENANFPIIEKRQEAINRYNAWQEILITNPNKFLILNYNDVCSKPSEAIESLKGHLNDSFFFFNGERALEAIDTKLYLNRGQ